MIDKLKAAAIWRLDLIRHNDSLLSFGERLHYTLVVKGDGRGAEKVLFPVRKDGNGDRYLAFSKAHIYFDQDFVPRDERSFRDGIVELLKESFLYHTPYFTPTFRPKAGDTVFDVGANLGPMTLLMYTMVGPTGRVFCFEPAVFKSLQKTLAENHMAGCEVVPKAVSDSNGQIEMRIADASKESNIIGTDPPGGIQYETRKVEMVTLDDFVQSRGLDRVDFITMDIEGAEELALRGARQTLERFHPKLSIASYHLDRQGEPQHPKLVRLLKEMGYDVEEKGSIHILAH